MLGICVGMQILFDSGDEHGVETKGLGLLPGAVTRLAARRDAAHGLEHGRRRRPARCCSPGCRADARFYFVHSYAASDLAALHAAGARVTTATHDAAVRRRGRAAARCRAAQFHPEKSADAGFALLRNWVAGLLTAVSKERARRRAERLAVAGEARRPPGPRAGRAGGSAAGPLVAPADARAAPQLRRGCTGAAAASAPASSSCRCVALARWSGSWCADLALRLVLTAMIVLVAAGPGRRRARPPYLTSLR